LRYEHNILMGSRFQIKSQTFVESVPTSLVSKELFKKTPTVRGFNEHEEWQHKLPIITCQYIDTQTYCSE